MNDRPLGPIVAGWVPAPRPASLDLRGSWARVRTLDPAKDSAGLWAQFEGHDWVWDYLGQVPPADLAGFTALMETAATRTLQPCYVVSAVDDPAPLGYACYWTVVPEAGNIEIGNVNLSPALQRTPIATEAFFLMIDWAFAQGYRRVEWKCNALNAPSRRAAQRMGFGYEGLFRNHLVVLGRNRDTAWFAITDDDWKNLRPAFQAWLSAENFDAQGHQNTALSTLTAPYLFAADPTLR